MSRPEPLGNTRRMSLNTATVREQWNLEQCVDGCLRHGVPAISPWRDKLQAFGVQRAARLFADNGLTVSGLCRAGFFAAPDAAGRQKALDDCRIAVDEAAEIGAQSLCILAGGLAEGSKDLGDAHGMVRDGLAELLDYARTADVNLGIEPLHPMYAADRACVNTLRHANDLCDDLGDGIGVLIDVYHLWWDPQLAMEIARAGRHPGRILGFHVSDWLVPTRDLLTDRGMMGDGVIDIPRLRGWVEFAGYDGYIEVEIFSAENWWKRDGDDVMTVATQRFASVI